MSVLRKVLASLTVVVVACSILSSCRKEDPGAKVRTDDAAMEVWKSTLAEPLAFLNEAPDLPGLDPQWKAQVFGCGLDEDSNEIHNVSAGRDWGPKFEADSLDEQLDSRVATALDSLLNYFEAGGWTVNSDSRNEPPAKNSVGIVTVRLQRAYSNVNVAAMVQALDIGIGVELHFQDAPQVCFAT
jgi:hypothetical protein